MKRAAYVGFKGLAWVIAVVVLAQFFLAGIGVFGEESWGDGAFNPHRIAGLLLVPASLLLLILAGISFFTGGTRGGVAGMAALLFALMIVQAILVIAFSESAPLIAALHPVNALILLGLSFGIARSGRSKPAGAAAPGRAH